MSPTLSALSAAGSAVFNQLPALSGASMLFAVVAIMAVAALAVAAGGMRAVEYPGLSSATSQAFETIRYQQPIDLNVWNVRRKKYYDRQNVIAAGTLDTSVVFFAGSPNKFQSNWPGPQGLPNDTCAWLRGIRLKIQQGCTVAGVTDTDAAAAVRAAAGATNPILAAEAYRWLNENGEILVKVGDREIAAAFGVESFPAGAGLDGYGALATTVTTMEAAALYNNNGQTIDANMYNCIPWAPILPGKPVTFTIDYQGTPPTITNMDFVIKAELDCILLSPVNN